MKVLGRRPDGALHLALGSGVSVILRGGYASPPSDERLVTRLGPWHRATSFDAVLRRRIELRLDRSRVIPLVALAAVPTQGVADDGMWSCPACGHENAVALSAGCEVASCVMHLYGTAAGAAKRKSGDGGRSMDEINAERTKLGVAENARYDRGQKPNPKATARINTLDKEWDAAKTASTMKATVPPDAPATATDTLQPVKTATDTVQPVAKRSMRGRVRTFSVDVPRLRQLAAQHAVLYEHRILLGGTSEGASKGWETRKAGGGGAEAEAPKKEGIFAKLKRKVTEAAARSNEREAAIRERLGPSTGSAILDRAAYKDVKREFKAKERAARAAQE
jgi:hypothetical protein